MDIKGIGYQLQLDNSRPRTFEELLRKSLDEQTNMQKNGQNGCSDSFRILFLLLKTQKRVTKTNISFSTYIFNIKLELT